MILDTNYLIQLFKGHRGAHKKARELYAKNEIQRSLYRFLRKSSTVQSTNSTKKSAAGFGM